MRSRRRARRPRSSGLALPSRFALVEVVNNHDDALQFEPIHRVLFGVDHEKFMKAFQAAYPNAYEGKGEGHTIAVCLEQREPLHHRSRPEGAARRRHTAGV